MVPKAQEGKAMWRTPAGMVVDRVIGVYRDGTADVVLQGEPTGFVGANTFRVDVGQLKGATVVWQNPFDGWKCGKFEGLAPGDGGSKTGDPYIAVHVVGQGVVHIQLSAVSWGG